MGAGGWRCVVAIPRRCSALLTVLFVAACADPRPAALVESPVAHSAEEESPAIASALLRVDVRESNRPDILPRSPYRVVLQEESTGRILDEVRSHEERAESFRVPAGRYRITALGTERVLVGLPGRWQPRELGRASVVVEATAGAELDVPLRLAQGGHLRVDVRGSLTAAEVAAEERIIEESMVQLEVDRSTVLHIMGAPHHSLTLHLESLDGGPNEEVLHFVDPVPWLIVTGGTGSVVDRWSLGERDESFVLSTGSFLLRGTFPGRPDVVVPVEIRAGEVTDVTLVLGP